MEHHPDEDALEFFNRLLERLHQADQTGRIELIYVASGAQHIDTIQTQNVYHAKRQEVPKRIANPGNSNESAIMQCLSLLMAEQYDDEPLFNLQGHWQAVYRILVDKGYCRDSDFDGFDAFIRRVMPEEVNKPYKKESVKQISKTEFAKPFDRWCYAPQTSTTRKPFDRMTAVARRFKEILEENGL